MKFNSAVYATRETKANARQAVSIKLDCNGNPTNTRPTGQPFTMSEVIAAQEAQSYQAYQGAMTFLDSIIGDDADTATRKAFDQATAKFASAAHAAEMKDKLVVAALNGSNAALIAYAAASLFLNPYAAVDFGWFVNGSDDLKVVFDLEGYQAARITVSVSAPFVGHESDYEGFVVTYRPTPKPVIEEDMKGLSFTLNGECATVVVSETCGIDAEDLTLDGNDEGFMIGHLGKPMGHFSEADGRFSFSEYGIACYVKRLNEMRRSSVTYRPAPVVPVTVARPTREKHAPAPAAPTVAPALPVPTPEKPAPAQPMTLVHSHGSELVRTANGWQAESKSNPGQTHTTSHDGSYCTCAGFRGRYRKCWHTATVRAYVADQQRQDRANALPVMPRRRGRSKMWK